MDHRSSDEGIRIRWSFLALLPTLGENWSVDAFPREHPQLSAEDSAGSVQSDHEEGRTVSVCSIGDLLISFLAIKGNTCGLALLAGIAKIASAEWSRWLAQAMQVHGVFAFAGHHSQDALLSLKQTADSDLEWGTSVASSCTAGDTLIGI